MFGNLLHPAIEHISLRFHRPFISISLARIDAALGLDWTSYYNFIHHNTFIEFLTKEAYNLFDIQLLICPLALAFSDKENVVMKYLARISTCLLIIDLIFIFYPADNASILYKIYDADPEKWHNDIIFCMNSRSKLYDITSNLDGLVSFPSFHVAGAIILIYSVYKMKLFFPFLLNGILIIMAVPAWGGHYFIDAIAGFFVAIFSILLVDFPLEWLLIACLMRIKRN